MSNKVLALVAVAGLALAGYASAASVGLLPEGADLGMGKSKRCERADADAEGAPLAACAEDRARHGKGTGMERRDARRGPEGPGPHHGPPPFRMANGTVEGQWVRFQVDEATASLRDYASRGPFADTVVFDRVQLSRDSEDDGMRIRGPLWLGKEGRVFAASFNAPNALLGVKNTGAEAVTVTFDVADGIAAEAAERGVNLTHDGKTAFLRVRGNGTLALAGDVVTATLGEGDAVVFAIEGHPRMLHHQVKVLQHIARAWEERPDERRAPDRPAAGAEAPEA